MTGPLRVRTMPAKSGKAEFLVVFLHGYGADGADLIGLADYISGELPDACFVSPDAPEPCAINPGGRQWFPVPWMDGSTDALMQSSFRKSAAVLDSFLDEQIESAGVGAGRTMLFGFSQGAMMSLHVAPRRRLSLAGVVAASGRLLAPGLLKEEAVSRPPIMLMHGDSDEVVLSASLREAEKHLLEAGFQVETHIGRGVGHSIPPDGLAAARRFLGNCAVGS